MKECSKILIHYREYSLIKSIDNKLNYKDSSSTYLINIIPRQLDNHHYSNKNLLCKRTRRYFPEKEDRYFTSTLNSDKLTEALNKANVKESNYSVHQEGNLIWYTYEHPLKPTIILRVDNGKFYTLKTMLEKFELPLIELQAYIIIEILKKAGLSNTRRGKSKFAKPQGCFQ